MWINIWNSEIDWIYIWWTAIDEVYLWDVKVRPSTSLKSYEEIVAMATAETSTFASALAELNSHPSEYYNKLSSEWYMTTGNLISVSKNDTINPHRFWSVAYWIKYDNWTWIRYKYWGWADIL